jgi:hypothetical protein
MTERFYKVDLAVCHAGDHKIWDEETVHIHLPDTSEDEYTEGEIWEEAVETFWNLHKDPSVMTDAVAVGLLQWERLDDEDDQDEDEEKALFGDDDDPEEDDDDWRCGCDIDEDDDDEDWDED